MSPRLSRPAVKVILFSFFYSFRPQSGKNSTFGFWRLIVVVWRQLHHNNQTPKVSYSFELEMRMAQARNGIIGRGPPQAGRMPFMPAASLNRSHLELRRLRASGLVQGLVGSVRFLLPFFCLLWGSMLWPSQRLLSETRAW